MNATRAELEDERAFLLRSIEDLDAERAAGDLSEADHRALLDRYTARAAAVLRALEQAGTPPGGDAPPAGADTPAADPAPDRRGRRRHRRALLWGACALFAAAAVVLVATELATRLPGDTATGSIRLGSAQEIQRALAQAQDLESAGRSADALALYRQVLRADPTQEQALAESGWLEYEAGVAGTKGALLTQGQRDEEAAEQADPSAYAPHLYLGSMLLVEHQPGQAADEFALFLGSDPPTTVAQRAWSFIVRAYTEAGRPVPAAPPGVSG